MAATVANALQSKEVKSLDDVRLRPAKATIERPVKSTPVQDDRLGRLSSTVESALLAAHGKKAVAALEIGIDQSQMNRQIRIGTFDLRQMSAAGDEFLAAFGEALVDQFGAKKKDRRKVARDLIPQLMGALLVLTESGEDK